MQKTSKLREFLKSLRFRIILLVVIVAIVPSWLVGNVILSSYESRALQIRETEVLNQARIVSNQIATSGYMDGNRETVEVLRAQIGMMTTLYDGRILIVDDNFRILYDTYNLDDNRTIISEEVDIWRLPFLLSIQMMKHRLCLVYLW